MSTAFTNGAVSLMTLGGCPIVCNIGLTHNRINLQGDCSGNDMDAPTSDVLSIEKIAVNDEEIGGFIALATINRPNKLNALNSEVMEALKNFCAWAEADSQIRCIVITGAKPLAPPEGKRPKPNAFVAGADISEMTNLNSYVNRLLERPALEKARSL